MEGILAILAVIFGWAIIRWLLSAATRTVGAAGKALVGKGNFSDNMDLAFKGMQAFEVQLVDTNLNEDGSGPQLKEIQAKGLLPVNRATDISFVTSVFDKTGDEYSPVISVIDTFQEEGSAVYQHFDRTGIIEPDQGFVRWVRIGVVIPDVIVPPYGGDRDLVAVIRIVDNNNLPNLEHGYTGEDTVGILWQSTLEFSHTFEEKGYLEASEHRDEACALSLKIGMAVAMADGSLDDSEGLVLKKWVQKSIAPYNDDKSARLKKVYNSAMKDAYDAAKSGDLALSDLTARLNEIGEKTSKYETLELCFEVMAADGVADAEEITLINKVAEALSLDMDEVDKMRDQQLVSLDTNAVDHASIEIILGIEQSWSNDEIKKHLRKEFQKWNNRLNTLNEGDERQNAQLMLERIAEARKKYA